MATIKWRTALLILIVSGFALTGCESSEGNANENSEQNIIVILKFKAQPEKGVLAVSELTNLIENVKQEPNFVEITLHVDPQDNSNILLYEEWEDEDYYNSDHMQTEHITEFMEKSRDFLTGPPDITFWKVKEEFE